MLFSPRRRPIRFRYSICIVRRSIPIFLVAVSIAVNVAAAPRFIQITAKPPKDLASRNASQTDLAKFAWQEFLALNWKASVDAKHPPSVFNQRGLPDLQWSYAKPAPQFPNPLVWQTYAQTTELRPNFPLTTPWQQLGIPDYSYQKTLVQGNGQNNLWNNLD